MGERVAWQRPRVDAGIGMARLSAARKAAFAVLGEVRRREARARELLRTSERLNALDGRDRALAVRIVLGVTASAGLLDACIDAHLKQGIKLEPKVRDALRMGAYELLFLDTPPSAAVSQAVELVRTSSRRAGGLANAVLRRIAEQEASERRDVLARLKRGERISVDDLALVSGYPVWLLAHIALDRGEESVQSVALAALEAAPVYVAANEALCTSDQADLLLEEAGLSPAQTDDALPGSFVLNTPAGLAASGLVESAKVVVADLSAQRVAQLVAPRVDARMLEVGQGRGTKSILLQNAARRAGAKVLVTGIDNQEFKTRVAKKRMERAGLDGLVSCHTFDARKLAHDRLPAELWESFDAVFVDAPCSGTGTMRRHPEIPWSLTAESIKEIVRLQEEILCAASSRVAPGGVLHYATCSVLRCENEDVVQAFFASEQGSAFEPVGDPLQTIPSPHAPDGHFCATLRRVASLF